MATPISSIGSVVYSNLAVAGVVNGTTAVVSSPMPAGLPSPTGAQWAALFNTVTSVNQYQLIPDVREFPAIGTPANIVNVPVYGQKQSQTVGGQSDAPTMDVTVNYVASKWTRGNTAAGGTGLGNLVGDGILRAWRFAMLTAKPSGAESATQGLYDSNVGGLGNVENAEFYWLGKVESLLVNPSLTDAVTATLSFSIQSDFYGAFAV